MTFAHQIRISSATTSLRNSWEINQHGSVGSPSPEGKVIESQLFDRSDRLGGQGHDTAQQRGGGGRQGASPRCEPCAGRSTGGGPDGFQGLTQANRRTCPGFDKGWEAFGKN